MPKRYSKPYDMSIDSKKQYTATIKTNQGDIVLKLHAAEAPRTVNNFVNLARDGFYDGVRFHRVIKDFMIQTGDPEGTGRGGPGYKFADEFNAKLKHDKPGVLSMANAGANTNGSQFFIVTASPSYPLPPNYTVFGTVTEGMDVALKIENVKTAANDRPVDNVTINSIQLMEK